jgi:hypothetical protein
MSTKDVANKKLVVGLGILCIILSVVTVGVVVYSTSEINSLKSQLSSRSSEIDSLNVAQLRLSDPDNPVGGVQYGSPRLGWTNEDSDLYVHGVVFNVGTYPAHNCRIHVVAASSNGTELLGDYIDLGTIDGGYAAKIDTRIRSTLPLTGSFNVTCTPEWS